MVDPTELLGEKLRGLTLSAPTVPAHQRLEDRPGPSGRNPGGRVVSQPVLDPAAVERTPAAGQQTGHPVKGTYGYRDKERTELARDFGPFVDNMATESSHLIDYVVAFPFPHLRRARPEGRDAANKGLASMELAAIHQKLVGSFYDEKRNGFRDYTHAFASPAEYRRQARRALSDGASDPRSGEATNLSNAIQLNLIEQGQIARQLPKGKIGPYETTEQFEVTTESFDRALWSIQPVLYVANPNEHRNEPVTNLSDQRITSQTLSIKDRIEASLGRLAASTGYWPSQRDISNTTANFTHENPDYYQEKSEIWEQMDRQAFYEGPIGPDGRPAKTAAVAALRAAEIRPASSSSRDASSPTGRVGETSRLAVGQEKLADTGGGARLRPTKSVAAVTASQQRDRGLDDRDRLKERERGSR